MEEKAVALKKPEDVWTPEQIKAIKDTVAFGANDSELKMFFSIAMKYDLDPFLREIWCVGMGNKITIMTGRDGYLKIANRDPNYNGMISDVVHAGDKFYKEGDIVKHAYNSLNRGAIIGAYAIVYRKDREHPIFCFAPFGEYNKGGRGVWGQYPSAMILKVAESMALKRAFSISGLVTEEEIGNGEIIRESTQKRNSEYERKKIIRNIWNDFVKYCGNDARIVMGEITGKTNSSEYTDEDIKMLINFLKEQSALKQEQEAEKQATETPKNPETVEAIDAEEVQNSKAESA